MSTTPPQTPPIPPSQPFPRSSYSPNNALRWLKFINQAIDTGESILVKFKQEGEEGYLAPMTMKNRIGEALHYLCNINLADFADKKEGEDFKEMEAYRKLRKSVTIRRMENGILIEFNDKKIVRRRTRQSSMNDYNTTVVDPHQAGTWKEDLLKFLESEDQKLYHKQGLGLSEKDIQWCQQTLAGMEYTVTMEKLTVVK